MSFLDIRLPLKLSFGSSSGLQFQTDVVTYGNGKTYRNSRWNYQRASMDLSYIVKDRADAVEVYNFFQLAAGRFNSFRVKDNFDYTSNDDGASSPTATDQSIGTGDGSETDFQLTKTYTNGAYSYTRNITKPVSGTVLVAVAGTPTTNFTIDTSTGIISLGFVPTLGQAITAGYEFDIEMRFDQDELEDIEYILLRQDSSKDYFTFPSLRVIEEL
ncbi:MAG: hypothetical protein Unbinned8472contig1000_2 [Prokaryotic dsDNA virus sp.]|nr:MAG: hypothetical protein Unbinned8472contig1000_2 [Prokaryotic dsDNA virus sp.]|tara:strand:+ start:21291 stop:21935 length:645 start_codon:yes stop_codon:yes gene_type:complete